MLSKIKLSCLVLVILFVTSAMFGATPFSTKASSTPEVSMINPGPDGSPSKWTAGPPRYLGTSDFIFYSNETAVNSTFFMNITIKNAEAMKGWAIGLIFDKLKLSYVSAWRPSDHVFKPVEEMGWTIVAPSVTFEDLNETHKRLMWGCTYIMGDPEWTFNGSGVLCQIQFKIIKEVNETYPKAVASFTFDPDWTSVYQHPSGTITPILGTAQYKYLYPIVPKVASLTFQPERVVDVSLVPTTNFNMSLIVLNATDLYHWQTKIYYKNQILNVTQVTEGNFLKSVGTTVFELDIQRDYNSTHGQISMNCYLEGAEFGVFGDGELAKITFEVLDLGDSPIVLLDDSLFDSAGASITHTKGTGYFSNVLVAKLSIDPSEIRDPSLVPCTNFTVNVTLDDVENMKVLTFNLTYDREILLELQVNFPAVLGQIPSKKLLVDDESGYIWVNLTYPNVITTYENVTVATITFHVEGMGISPIDLEDTELKDPQGRLIAHEVYDGIFIGLIRDVAVLRIDVSSTSAYTGWLVYVNVTVRNNGNLTETFDVKGKYDGTLFAQTTVVDLPPDTETTVMLAWNTTGVTPCHNYTISAEAGPVPYEMNLADNNLLNGTVKIKQMGDITGDGRVNMDDINIVVSAFGSFPGHPRWNSDADLDQNGRISMSDIIFVVMNFGKIC